MFVDSQYINWEKYLSFDKMKNIKIIRKITNPSSLLLKYILLEKILKRNIKLVPTINEIKTIKKIGVVLLKREFSIWINKNLMDFILKIDTNRRE